MMLFRVTQPSILGFVILWLAYFTSLSYTAHSGHHSHLHTHHRRVAVNSLSGWTKAKLNERAHTYERLYMWEAYKILGQAEGADKQQLIFPFRDEHSMKKKNGKMVKSYVYADGLSNQHLVNGERSMLQLDYVEFMLRMEGKSSVTLYASDRPAITAPTSEDDLERAEKELNSKRYYGLLPMNEVSPYLKGESDSDKLHIRFVQKVVAKMDAIKADSGKASLGDNSDRLARIETIRQRTISLRKAQTENWLIGELSRDDRWNLQESEEVDDGTGGKQTIHRTTVVTVDNADTGVPGEDSISKYQGINFPATFEKSGNKAKIQKKKLTSGEDFETWAKELGEPAPSTNGPSAGESSTTHWQEIDTWERSPWIDCL